MSARRWALSLGVLFSLGVSGSARADWIGTHTLGETWWIPEPYWLFLESDTHGDVVLGSQDFYRARDEECTRSWSEYCQVWIAETGGEVSDVSAIMAAIRWDDERNFDYQLDDWDVSYYHQSQSVCVGSDCELGYWSSDVDVAAEWLPMDGYSEYYGVGEWDGPASSYGHFDYDEFTPVVRFDFLITFAAGMWALEWTEAIEIWTE